MKISQKNSVVSQNLEWNAQLCLCSQLLDKAVGRKRTGVMSRTISKSGLEWIEQKLNEPMKQCWIKLRCKMFGQWTMCVFNVHKRLSGLPMNCGRLPQMIASLAFWQKMKPANIATVWEFLGWLKWKCLHPCDHQESLQSVNKSDYKMLNWNK